MNNNFLSIEYLKKGNIKQKKVYNILKEFRIFEILHEFNPILTGTIPLGIETPYSDLDIICYSSNKLEFEEVLIKNFSKNKNFKIFNTSINTIDTIIAKFELNEEFFEIFGQNRNSIEQEAYLHLLKESYILKSNGELFKRKIIELKLAGLKTEPAFAKLLNLKGNPYQAILDYPCL